MKLNPYQALLKAQAAHCAGKKTKSEVNEVAKKYVRSTVEAGNRTKAEADKVVKRVTSTCTGIGATKRRKASKKVVRKSKK